MTKGRNRQRAVSNETRISHATIQSIHSLLSVVILVVFRYAVKYNEQLILTLEEDEFSCKQRLAYKLEQVHNIMQGDAQ